MTNMITNIFKNLFPENITNNKKLIFINDTKAAINKAFDNLIRNKKRFNSLTGLDNLQNITKGQAQPKIKIYVTLLAYSNSYVTT